ncbi:MAG: hypothetical protein EOL91_11255 [Actinobacteria bacterium]|nr:hypothetical protein [Actinomycetota bacterium]
MTIDASLAISLVSLFTSLYVFWQQRVDHRKEREAEVGRQDYTIMLDVYRNWLATEEQECRRVLYDAHSAGALFADLPEETKAKINHAIASMNVVALLRSAGRVPMAECDELFGSTIVRVVRAAEGVGYFEWRRGLTGTTPWVRLRRAAESLSGERTNDH